MQTTLARRQRHRRLGIRQRPRGSSALKRTAIALPIILFGVFAAAGALGLLGVAAAYTYYANGLPNPELAEHNKAAASAARYICFMRPPSRAKASHHRTAVNGA